MAERELNPASPEIAWRNGAAAAEAGDYGDALLWLDRAVRTAPNDPRIALDLANVRLSAGGAEQANRAAVEFEKLTERYEVAAAWLGLLAARRLAGDHAGAAAALQELLSRHCVPQDQNFTEAALLIARAAGRPGWCGIDASLRVQISAAPGVALSCFLDGKPVRLRHQQVVPDTGKLTVRGKGVDLLGCPIDLAAMQRVEGVVETVGAAIAGWASRPAAPIEPPELVLIDAKGQQRTILVGAMLAAEDAAPLTVRHGFRCSVDMLKGLKAPFRVVGPDQKDILGSPINPGAEMAVTPVPAGFLGSANKTPPKRAGLAVVVPVYRGLAVTQACLNALLEALPARGQVIVVDDATPEPELAAWLDRFSQDKRVQLIRHRRNLGFPEAANAGLRAAGKRDVLLLNSDTLVPPGAIETLLEAVYARREIGSATPFSNEATILSYPLREGGNTAPDLAGTIVLNDLAAKANKDKRIEIPTGVGFCLLMRHDCIGKTGLFRTDLFAQGYGEEVDWCLRARHRGFRHVAAAGAYVAHHGGVSFQAAGRALNVRNGRILNRLHPGYDALIAAFIEADPIAPARHKFDAARFQAGRHDYAKSNTTKTNTAKAGATKAGAVLLISHNHGGGVGRRLDVEMARLREAGLRPILLCPAMPADDTPAPFPRPAQLTDGKPENYPNLQFTLPEDEPALLRLLKAERVGHAVLHHGLGHHASVRDIAEKLGCPQDIVIHDYASFCARVHLVGVEKRYCGEPNLSACTTCVLQAGDETSELLGPKRLIARSKREFERARRITAPSMDTSRRIARHFPGVLPAATPWEDDTVPVNLEPPRNGRRRIAIIGGINVAKGYDVLLECAQDANDRDLPLDFLIAGSSLGDEALVSTGRIFITGPYKEIETAGLIAGLRADLAFIPSIWPETWCFTLSEAWRAGLYTLAFDLGAQAERIAATGRGALLPLGLPAGRVNDALLAWNPR